MTDLSPQAQAIVDAYENTTDKYEALAAVLRALNEYVVLPKYQYAEWELANAIHQEIESVADELEHL
jgi:hypothetical protein